MPCLFGDAWPAEAASWHFILEIESRIIPKEISVVVANHCCNDEELREPGPIEFYGRVESSYMWDISVGAGIYENPAIIRSMAELVAHLKFGSGGSFADMFSMYTEEFFAERALVVWHTSVPHTGFRHRVDAVCASGVLSIARLEKPIGADVPINWHIIVEVENDNLPDRFRVDLNREQVSCCCEEETA